MAYESPLVHLLGIEGQALLRALTGPYGRGFVDARLAEIRRLLADPALDGSPDMLAKARVRVPRPGTAPRRRRVRRPGRLAEFGRVLRPGGHLITSGMHPDGVARGKLPPMSLPDGRAGRIAGYRHAVGDHVRAALAAGLRIRRCEEPTVPAAGAPVLGGLAVVAARPDPGAAVPAQLIRHFQRTRP